MQFLNYFCKVIMLHNHSQNFIKMLIKHIQLLFKAILSLKKSYQVFKGGVYRNSNNMVDTAIDQNIYLQSCLCLLVLHLDKFLMHP